MEFRNKLAMCRLCLCENEYFINVFELNCGHGHTAAEVISDLLQFQVSETDGYPHVVCSECLVKLTDFKQFKECCQRSKVKYDNMFVSSERPENHQSEMREFVTVIAEPVFYLANEANISKDVGSDLHLCDQDPLSEASSHDEVIDSQTSEYSSATVNPKPSNDELISSDIMASEITVKVESLEVQVTDAHSALHPQDLLCLEHFSPNSLPKEAYHAGSSSGNLSTDGESTSERSKNIPLSVELEASTGNTTESLEGQQISPRGMYMHTSVQCVVGIVKEEEEGWSEGEEGREGTTQVKNQVVGVSEANVSCREMSRHMSVAPSTVTRIKRKWETEHSFEQREGQGRPRSTTGDEDIKMLGYVGENPFTSSTQARIETNFQAGTRTLRPRITATNPQPKKAAIKEVLAPAHRAARLEFARAHRGKGEEFWSRVIFSDKQRFFSAPSGPAVVYRPPSTRFDANYIPEGTRSGRISVQTWAWICADSPGVCCRLDGPLNGEKYVQILDNVMLPSVTSLFADDFIFQQDNSRVHSSMIARRWFEEKQIIQLVWPSWSPDLNPIENIWACIARKINNKNVRAENPDELWRQIEVEWNCVTAEFCRSVVNSMPKRMELVIQNRGELIDYEIMT